MPGKEIDSGKRIPVRAATHTTIHLSPDSPKGAKLVIEHLRLNDLLARECRPVATGTKSLEIKIHPDASHITCVLEVHGRSFDGVQFTVDSGPPILPVGHYFIVIGAMKAGTTTLFEMLAQHPALCRTWAHTPKLSSPKEINYFRHLYREGNTALHYDWRFPFDAGVHAWTLDVSPSYAKSPSSKAVSGRIASLGGRIKLAYILREPVDRIESHFAHKLHTVGKIPRLGYCIRTSSYAMHLDEYARHFEREDILLLDFDQLRRSPAVIMGQVCEFLGIDLVASQTQVHNKRRVGYRLDTKQRGELAERLRPDVHRLIDDYGFRSAEKWLQKPLRRWIRPAAFRR